MKFDDMEKRMRVYEDSMSYTILPGLFMVARLDGRGFTRLTKEICDFEAPYDDRFRGNMVQTVKHLMDCGFRVVFGYTQSDEISLLFHKDEETFGRKARKYLSVLAGEASASFSLILGTKAVFDCRMIPLPSVELVQDYFLWRQEDAHRNALNSHCYWFLRKEGMSAVEATKELSGKSVSFKNELLFSKGVNFDKLPLWQKRGIGVYWQDCEIEGYNPVRQERERATRRNIFVDDSLPLGQEYAEMISGYSL